MTTKRRLKVRNFFIVVPCKFKITRPLIFSLFKVVAVGCVEERKERTMWSAKKRKQRK